MFFEDKYSFVFDKQGKLKSRYFASRQDANIYMYKLCNKYNLHIDKIYDDKHNKTYICSNNCKFYIQRVY